MVMPDLYVSFQTMNMDVQFPGKYDFMLKLLIVSCCSVQICYGIKAHSLSGTCPSMIGPVHGAVLRWAWSGNSSAETVPENKIECWTTLRGIGVDAAVQKYAVGVPERYNTLSFRSFKVNGWNAESGSCTTGYMELYGTDLSGNRVTPPVWSSCGNKKPPEFTTKSQNMQLHLVIEKNPGHNSSAEPEIFFTADFTSYFIGNCTNDPNMLACNNSRCIDPSLACDSHTSQNCGDGSDESLFHPSYCPVIDEFVLNEAVLYAFLGLLGLLLLLAILYWCCWRPGWCPWRLCRYYICRQCCKNPYDRRSLKSSSSREKEWSSVYDSKKSKCAALMCLCCRCCPAGGGGSYSTASGSGKSSMFHNGGGGGMFSSGNSGNSVEPWWEFAQQDGAHVREGR